MISHKIVELTFENITYLQNEINRIDNLFPLSVLNLYTWRYYDSKVYFCIEDNSIYLYLCKKSLDKQNSKSIIIMRPIIEKGNEVNIKEHYLKSLEIIQQDLENCCCHDEIQFGTFNQQDLNLFKKVELLDTFNAAYLYPTNQLKYMVGKKMQKKRNFVNFFKKNYEQNSVIEKYNPNIKEQIIEFCTKESVDKESQETREYEIDALKETLKLSPETSYGTTLFYENKIIGFTYGFITNDKYEIFIEKADKNFKGSYQYLLSKNLELNNIQTTLIDRQDDMYSDNLMQSKLSYKPSEIVHIYFFKAISK